ncbi:MAG: hypothetical protein MUP47_01420 [Phycisphaerae bacterium]|nr:hypothetical protein [Phycisphaerae bacterium]
MDGRQTTPRRAVVFASCAPGQGLLEGLEPAPGCIPTASAYEAAAELLAGPAAALVVDLRVLRPSHVRLIEIARKAGAELLGVGPLPAWASSDQLRGMRLVSQGQLVESLRAAAGAPAPSRPAAQPRPAPRPKGPQPPDQGGTYKADGAAPKAPGAEGEPLLTAEELSALLGDVE